MKYYQIREILNDGSYHIVEVVDEPASSLLDDYDWDMFDYLTYDNENYFHNILNYLTEHYPDRKFELIKITEEKIG
jgi:hypothetical protein